MQKILVVSFNLYLTAQSTSQDLIKFLVNLKFNWFKSALIDNITITLWKNINHRICNIALDLFFCHRILDFTSPKGLSMKQILKDSNLVPSAYFHYKRTRLKLLWGWGWKYLCFSQTTESASKAAIGGVLWILRHRWILRNF